MKNNPNMNLKKPIMKNNPKVIGSIKIMYQ